MSRYFFLKEDAGKCARELAELASRPVVYVRSPAGARAFHVDVLPHASARPEDVFLAVPQRPRATYAAQVSRLMERLVEAAGSFLALGSGAHEDLYCALEHELRRIPVQEKASSTVIPWTHPMAARWEGPRPQTPATLPG